MEHHNKLLGKNASTCTTLAQVHSSHMPEEHMWQRKGGRQISPNSSNPAQRAEALLSSPAPSVQKAGMAWPYKAMPKPVPDYSVHCAKGSAHLGCYLRAPRAAASWHPEPDSVWHHSWVCWWGCQQCPVVYHT